MKKYIFPPDNFGELNDYIISDRDTISQTIIKSNSIFYYDTCSLRHHSKIPDCHTIFEYINTHGGLVIILNIVITELASGDGSIQQKEIDYLRKMSEFGIKIIVLEEEQIIPILNLCYASYEKINNLLSMAVKDVVPASSSIRKWILSQPELYKAILQGEKTTNREVGSSFFSGVKQGKHERDDLGEILIAVCIHLLTSIPVDNLKSYVFTDDKGAVSIFGRMNTKRDRAYNIYVLSTARFCWVSSKMFELYDKHLIESILSSVTNSDSITVSCTVEYDMKPFNRTYKISELADLIINDKTFSVFN